MANVTKIRYNEIVRIKELMFLHPDWSKAKIASELGLCRIQVTRIVNKIARGESLKYEVPGPYKSNNSEYYKNKINKNTEI